MASKFACFLILVLIPTSSSLSHHSLTAVYEVARTVSLTGTLTEVDWRNPHVEISLDVEDIDGTLRSWTLQGASPGFFPGDSKNRFQRNIGKTVTAEVYPGRNGISVGGLLKITFPDNSSVVSVPCC